MNKKEFSHLADTIRTYYPHANIMPNEEAMSLWYEELKMLPLDVALASVRYHLNTSSRIITIYDIKSNIADTRETWEIGYDKVIRAIGKYGGMYNAAAVLESLDDVTRAAVKSIGFKEFCCSENPDMVRAQFRMAYENAKERKENNTIIEATTIGISAPLNQAAEFLSNYAGGNEPERKSITWEK